MNYWGFNSFDCDHVEDSFLNLLDYILQKVYGDLSLYSDEDIEQFVKNISNNLKKYENEISKYIEKNYEDFQKTPNYESKKILCEIILGLTLKIFKKLNYYTSFSKYNIDNLNFKINIDPVIYCSNYLLINFENERNNFIQEIDFITRKIFIENEITFFQKIKEKYTQNL